MWTALIWNCQMMTASELQGCILLLVSNKEGLWRMKNIKEEKNAQCNKLSLERLMKKR
jgi:hypothetical protein